MPAFDLHENGNPARLIYGNLCLTHKIFKEGLENEWLNRT